MPEQPQPPPARGFLSKDAPPAFFAHSFGIGSIKHGFFGRAGGVSRGIYASLNAGPGSKDDPVAVAENRARIAAAFGAGAEQLLSLHQVHSASCATVAGPWTGARPEADALVTTTPGLVISVLTADCAPVLLCDPEARVIGAAHAGWRGAFTGVLEATLDAMIAQGAEPHRIRAAIGPCIAQRSYEVGAEFQARFLDADADNAHFFKTDEAGAIRFDLPFYCATRLLRRGLNEIESLNLDTYEGDDAYFSARRGLHAREPDYGRNCAAIMLATN